MQYSIIFVVLAITLGRSLSQHCEVVESQHECGGYCFGAVKPVLEYLAILQKRVESCEAKQPADTLSKVALMANKLETLERQMAIQQELLKIIQPTDLLSKFEIMDEKLGTLRTEMATKKDLDEKLETLRNQTATQQTAKQEALEKSSKQLADTLSKFALMDEKLETLRTQTATQQEVEQSSKQSVDALSKNALLNEKLESLRNQMATQEDLEKSSKQLADTLSKFSLMDEKLETLRTQMSTQEELEKRSQSRLERLDHFDQFHKIGSKYYYIENKIKMNWHDALIRCREMGTHLVSLQSEDEWKALYKKVDRSKRYWIDLNDLKTEGEYISATTGLKGTFFNWIVNEPNDDYSSEDCVELKIPDGRMNDIPCGELFNFICETSWD